MTTLAEQDLGSFIVRLDRVTEQARGPAVAGFGYPFTWLEDVALVGVALSSTPVFTGSTLGVHGYESARVLFSYMPPFLVEDPYLRDLLWAMAIEFDHLRAGLDTLVDAQFIDYAPEWALRLWEEFVGVLVAPSSLTEAQRRARVKQEVWIGARTLADFEAFTAEFFGVDPSEVVITEDFGTYTVQVIVSIGLTEAEQEAFQFAFRRFLPAHLAVNFVFGGFIAGINLAGDIV
jgi:hypothetical protein